MLYNTTKIRNWYNDFSLCKNVYTNNYHFTFQGSYINSAGNDITRKMKSKLDNHYIKIRDLYDNLNSIWNQYISDLENIEYKLSGKKASSIQESSVSSLVSQLPYLKTYNIDLSDRINALKGKYGIEEKWENFKDTFEAMAATGAVFATSVISGIAKLIEAIFDGAIWTGGIIASSVTWLFDKDASKKIQEGTMDVIAYDVVGNLNKQLYENTEIGRTINEKSKLKYDSKEAMMIQNISLKAGEIALATAISILTAGAGTPVVVATLLGTGFVLGAGQKAEENFSQEDRDFYGDAKEIIFAGTVKSVEFYSEGMMVAGLLKTAGAVKSFLPTILKSGSGKILTKEGLKTLGSQVLSGLKGSITKENVKKGLSLTFKDVDTYVDSVGAATNNIKYSKEEGIEVNWKGLLKESIFNFALNGTSSFAGNILNKDIKNAKKYSDDELELLMEEYNRLNIKSQDPYFKKVMEMAEQGFTVDGDYVAFKKDLDRMKEIENVLVKYTIDDVKSVKKYSDDELELLMEEYNRLNIKSQDPYFRKVMKMAEQGFTVDGDYVAFKKDLDRMKEIEGILAVYAPSDELAIKHQLDKAREILDEWGRKRGIENYAEIALRQFAETGSIYGPNGKPYITNNGGIREYIKSLNPEFVASYLRKEVLNSSDYNKLHSFFMNTGSTSNSTYGVDQGGIERLCEYTLGGKKYSYHQASQIINEAKKNGQVIPRFSKSALPEYFELKNKLISRGMSEGQASIILSSLDDVGACTYAAKANAIFYQFSNNPDLFEKKFGFPMYKVNANGSKTLNSNELILDMYVYVNDVKNGGKLISKNINNTYDFHCDKRIDVFGRRMLNTKQQVYLSAYDGTNVNAMKSYLKSKKLDYDSYILVSNFDHDYLTDQELISYIEAIDISVMEGKAIQLSFYSHGNEIRMISTNPNIYSDVSTHSWNEGGGHAVFITGRNSNGFLVSSWGKEYLIPYSDLQNGGSFNIMIDSVIN